MKTDREFWTGEMGKKWVEAQPQMDAILVPFAEAILDAAQLPNEGVLVDVGCGCGATTLMVAQRNPRLRVLGVDISAVMLDHARGRAAHEGIDVEFVNGDATSARPINGDGDVDRIISRFGVMFFDDPAAAFANMRGWLAPGGLFVAAIWGPVADNPWVVELVEVVRRHVEIPMPSEEGPGPFSLASVEGVERLFHAAGFVSVDQRPLDLPMRIAGSVEDGLRFQSVRMTVESALKEADAATKAAILDDIREYVVERHDGEALTLGASARLVCARVRD